MLEARGMKMWWSRPAMFVRDEWNLWIVTDGATYSLRNRLGIRPNVPDIGPITKVI
jgi:hypothetical protein